uniref:Uncharacterized protein n=1 Tax=Acrobeloides nanus TaxID=290746 RepID=A0A914C423_9BILA
MVYHQFSQLRPIEHTISCLAIDSQTGLFTTQYCNQTYNYVCFYKPTDKVNCLIATTPPTSPITPPTSQTTPPISPTTPPASPTIPPTTNATTLPPTTTTTTVPKSTTDQIYSNIHTWLIFLCIILLL